MNEQDYLASRLQDQIDWYERKSLRAQRWFKWLRTLELIAAAAIPFMSGFTTRFADLTLVIGALGVLIAILSGLLSLNQFQERWLQYRATCEALKREKFLFLTGAAPYDQGNGFILLVQRVEDLIGQETVHWGQYMRTATSADREAATGNPPATESPDREAGAVSGADAGGPRIPEDRSVD